MKRYEDTLPLSVENIINNAFKIGISQVKSEAIQFMHFFQDKKIINIMEIGTKWGGNFYMLANIAQGKKISVDMIGGPFGGWVMNNHPYIGQIDKKRNNFFKNKFSDVYMIDGNSTYLSTRLQVEKILGYEKLDLLFIDGNHSYEGVKKDFEIYKDLVNNDGYIILHDINDTDHHRDIGVDVNRLWLELKGTKTELNANKHWAGIGIISNWK